MASISDEGVVLNGDFFLLAKKKSLHKVTLTRRRIFYSPDSYNGSVYEEKCIQISDIIGCHILDSRKNVTLPGVTLQSLSASKISAYSNDQTEELNFPGQHFQFVCGSEACGIVIFAYPFKKKMFSDKRTRCRQVLALEISSAATNTDEKRKEAEKWKNMINFLARDLPLTLDDIPNSVPPPRGKLLFLINPHSGPGKAHIIFKTEIVPMLFEADIPYKAFITDHAGHASELIKEINLSEWYGVVIVSGDGLIYETINGIMQRDDWASAIKIPVGCLPGGSGNALCCAINYAAGEPLDASMVLHSTFVLTKHKVIPMDLVAVHIPNQTIFSFLSVTWGIMADIDYESEKYRKLGEARFTIGAINRIFSLRTYRGRVSFLPVAEYNPKETGNSKKVLTKIRRFSLRSRSNSKSTNDSTESVAKQRCYSMDHSAYGERQMYLGDAKLDRGDHKEISGSSVDESMVTEDVFDKTSLNKEEMDIGADMSEQGNNVTNYNNKNDTESTNSDADQLNKDKIVSMVESLNGALEPKGDKNINQQTTQQKEKTENATTLNSSSVESGHMTILSEKQEIVVEEERYHCKKSDYAPFPTPLLPPLDQDVPDNWVKFEGDFILAAAVYQTHLGSDMLAAPDAHLQDGVIHLMMVREGISKAGLLKLFLSFGQGGHVHSPYVESAKVLAFRIEPSTTSGNIMIDGERFDPSPIQGQILPGLARVMAIQ